MLKVDGMLGSESRQSRWSRDEGTAKLAQFEVARSKGVSQRQFDRETGTPRSTLQYWLARKDDLDCDPKLREFLESPSGLAFIHQIVVAAHFCFGQMSPAGIRILSLFLRLSRLDMVVAASYGSVQAVSSAMEAAIVEFGGQQRSLLAKEMKPRLIVLCEDETFHPGICLVAIEPVSGFIVVERYDQKRDAEAWGQAVAAGLGGLPVTVIQVTSDRAKGIVKHVEQELGAHSGPDLFHVQHEVNKGVSLPLARQVRQADKALAKALERKEKIEAKLECQPRQPDQDKLEQAKQAEAEANAELKETSQSQEQMRKAIGGLGQDYHPYRLDDGTPREAAELKSELKARFEQMEQVAIEASLSQRCRQHIAKARRVLPLMVVTLAFFWERVGAWLAMLQLDAELEHQVRHQLIPGLYLEQVASKTSDPYQRDKLLDRAWEMLERARAPNGPLGRCGPERKESIEQVGRQCAELFQRSSSCVEGRNGRLELWHRSLHRLSNRKLAALTVLHNYFIKRRDGTTAAERFFGKRPADLFEWLLDRVALPVRPATARPFAQRKVA